MKKGAVYVSFSRYKSEDGILVERFVEKYKSQVDAADALDKLTKTASHILKQGQEETPNGQPRGDRVQLVFDHKGKAHAETVIAWTDGDSVIILRSSSAQCLADFEKRTYPLNDKWHFSLRKLLDASVFEARWYRRCNL
jgi:hypothetical protein